MKPSREQICNAAYKCDFPLLREYVELGADLNEVDKSGDTLLEEIIAQFYYDGNLLRYQVVKELITLGADPNRLGEEASSPLIPAMLNMDTEMLRILLEHGADPNKRQGFHPSETFYDWAEFDYRYQVYDFKMPESSSDDDKVNEEAWLRYLERLALKYNTRMPDHLRLLRQYGAKTAQERDAIAGQGQN